MSKTALAAAARKTADELRGVAQNALELASRYLYFLPSEPGRSAWRDNLPARTADLLDACPPEQRSWEWHYLDQQRRSPLVEF